MMNLQPNPILVREARARWRGGRPFLLLLGYAALLALMMIFIYGWTVLDPTRRASEVRHGSIIGHELFISLAWVQTLAWMLLGPALTAPVIAGERERGLLEGLQLSPLSPLKIVVGKFYAAMAFMVLMMLAPLPVLAICFMLGGVSPGEVWLSVLLQLAVAIVGASLGIACSARSHRSATAVARAFALLILWGVSSAATTILATPGLTVWPWVRPWALLYGMTNPIIAALTIPIQDFSKLVTASIPFIANNGIPPAAVCIVFCILASLLLLWSAMRALARPLVEAQWVDWKETGQAKRRGILRRRSTPAQPDTPGFDTSPPSTPQNNPRSTPPVPRFEMPVLSRLHFSNPVLQREIRGKTRLRQSSQLHMRVGVVCALIIVYCYLRVFYETIKDPKNQPAIWQVEVVSITAVVLLAAALMGAGSLAREREAGTWESLNLSLLKPWQIISGKLAIILMTCSLWVIVLLPLMLACVDYTGNTAVDIITPYIAILSFLLIAVSAWFAASFGMFLSWVCRRTMSAISWVIASMVMVFCFVPVALMAAAIMPAENLAAWHPVIAIGSLAELNRSPAAMGLIIQNISQLFSLGLVFLLVLNLGMRRDIRERDGNFSANSTAMDIGDTSGATLAPGQP